MDKNNSSTRFIRRDALEGIARKTLKEYDHTLLICEPRAIPIENIVEKHFGLSIEFHCLRKNGVILGETVFDDSVIPVYDHEAERYDLIFVNAGTIILDESLLFDKTDGRLRFTCAHELAHWLIHNDTFPCGEPRSVKRNSGKRRPGWDRPWGAFMRAVIPSGLMSQKSKQDRM